MAAPQHVTFQHRVEFAGFSFYEKLFAGMELERASAYGASLLAAIGPLTGAHQTALKNLRLAFPEESERWRREVARAMWAGIGRTVGEFPHLGEIKPFEEGGRIEVEGVERLDAVKASGKGAVFISGHFANWELMPAAIAQRGVPCRMTYRPANNPLIDSAILRLRQAYGANLQAAKGVQGGIGLQRSLMKGESVALMNDQKYNEGIAAPLFGHDAMTADGPTRLALRHKAALIPFSLRRLAPLAGRAVRYRMNIHEPLALDYETAADVTVPDVVRRINAFMEARIREAPEQWFWVHRRWPRQAWAQLR